MYHLALRCKAFADALSDSGKFDTVNQNVCAQLEGLLIGPWRASEHARFADLSTPPPLIIIDALDEIVGSGRSEFLRNLLDVINKTHLKGLKFFATSRPDPDLVAHMGYFGDKQLYHLEEVPFEEAQGDIKTYLNTELPYVGCTVIEKLVAAAAGLFIYVATVIKYLGKHKAQEQKKLIRKLLSVSNSNSTTSQMLPGVTALLDELYIQVLLHAFDGFEGEILSHQLDILFTFLCTSEHTLTSIVTKLFPTDDSDYDCTSVAETNFAIGETSIADNVLQRLHTVLYTENNKVLWHHKSFPDFLFNENRSRHFWCNQVKHHRLLTNSCFQVMQEGLRFNIANIPSSFIFDHENTTLPGEVE